MSIVQTLMLKKFVIFCKHLISKSRLGLGSFKSRSRLDFLLKVSVSKILAEIPALQNSLENYC